MSHGYQRGKWPEVHRKRLKISGSGGTGTSPHSLPRSFANTLLSRFNMEILSKRYKRTSADALKLAEHREIKMYLIFRIRSSPLSKRKQNIRQTTVASFYKTLQMVYQLDTKRQLGKPTNDMINTVSKSCQKTSSCYRNPIPHLFTEPDSLSSPRTCVSICMLIGC